MMTKKIHIIRGFTLIELVITIAVIALMAALAIPNLNNFLRSNRLTSQINSFVSALQIAKSEAIKRGINVVLCASTDQKNCNTTQWEQGWLVFVDDNTTQFTFAAPTSPTTSSQILRVGGQLSGSDTLRDSLSASGTNTTGAIIYTPTGAAITSTANNTGNTFTLCDPGTPPTPSLTNREKRALAINVLVSGVITLATDTDNSLIVNDYNNKDVTCP